MPGGMWSGGAGSRSFQPAGVASQQSFGVYQGGHRPRWSYPANRYQTTRRDHRGWSTHTAASRDRPAKPNREPNGIFIPSGEIGTHAMHPPGERITNINVQPFGIDTRGRTRRSAPTRRICDRAINNQIFTPTNATPGGMWSGGAGSRRF